MRQGGQLVDEKGTHNVKIFTKNHTKKTALPHTRVWVTAWKAPRLQPSCDDFLNTLPKDAMSPPTTWKTSDDAEKFLVGCYDGWEGGAALLYWDAGSDFGYNNFPWEGFTNIGNGSVSPSSYKEQF